LGRVFYFFSLGLLSGHVPNSDHVVGVTGKEGGSVRAPCEGEGSGVRALGLEIGAVVLVQIRNQGLALQIPDLDTRLGGSTEPVSGWAEAKAVNDISGIQGVEVLALIQVPQSGSSVLSTRSTQRTIRRDSHGVDVTGVSDQVGSEFAVGKVPDLDEFIPTSRDDDGVLNVGGESHAADPLRVTLILNGVLALSQSIPQLDGLVS